MKTRQMQPGQVRTGGYAVFVLAALVLAGCDEPRVISGGFAPASPAQGGWAQPSMVTEPAASSSEPVELAIASRAEAACVEAGRSQGLTVHQVVGTRPATDGAGQPTGRDVMLRVSRAGQMYEVRCNYASATDSARIMSL